MKNELRVLKTQRTKLLNKSVKTVKEFEMIQDKLHEIELRIKQIKEEK